ncbi:hypothetical protein EDB89DRAFT_1483303 [Lactarius sanguifluus]|nr:hypothetical protein EDB89DRAFT_1483303 [Lactarius sanguifluus]
MPRRAVDIVRLAPFPLFTKFPPSWFRWSDYLQNCTSTMEPSTFPNPVPAGTRVPQWALLDTTGANFWSAGTAQLVGDSPPGELIDTPASLSVTPNTVSASSHIVVPAPAPPVFTFPKFTPRQYTPYVPPINPFPYVPPPPDPFDDFPPYFPTTSSGSGSNTGSVVCGVTTIAAITGLVLSPFP